jgi:hypothetical protein
MSNVAVFDLDDTLLNLKEELMEIVSLELGKKVDHWCLWNGHHDFHQRAGIDGDQLKEICQKHKVFRTVRPHLFAPYLLRDLRLRGFKVVIVTAREGFVPNARAETEVYLGLHDLEYDELVITGHGQNKMDYLEHHDHIAVAVDDQVGNCEDFHESGKVDHTLLVALPGNKNCTLFPRIHNLYQVYNHLNLE